MKNINKIKIFFTILALTCSSLTMFQNCGAPSHTLSSIDLSSHHTDQNHWEKPIIETTYTPNIGDRFYIMSVLKDVFGPSAESVDTSSAGSQIYSRISDFGTPCSPYEDYRILNNSNARARAHADRLCEFSDRTDRMSANIISNATASRQGYMINLCTALVENNTTRNYALVKINGANFSGNAPAVTRQKLINLYANFYRGRPEPSPGVIDSLEMIFQYESDLVKAWKAALYAVCASNHWQAL